MCLYKSLCSPTGMLIFHMWGMCSMGSRQAEKEVSMYDDQDEKKAKNLALEKGRGDEVTTTSVRNARDWQLRTGPESTHWGGAKRSATSRAGNSGRRPCLASRLTQLFILSVVWAHVQENLRQPEWDLMVWRKVWNKGLWEASS